MRKEIDEIKNALKGKSTKNLDRMIKRNDSPFTSEVLECPLPQKFGLPQLESYDGHTDPLNHIESFKTLLNLQKTPNEEATQIWFSKLESSLIANFNKLSDSFVHHFIGAERHKRLTSHLLTMK